MKTRTREIARTGIFGSKDDPQIVTEKDLLEIVETFPEVKRAPVVFGHWPDAAAPRMGNVASVRYDAAAKSLLADIEEDDVLAGAVDAGYYPDVSIRAKPRAADGKMYLVHLAYLGQEAPAIKDLAASVREPLGIAAADDGRLRAFPSPSEKQFYLSDTPIKTFNNKDKEEVPEPGAETAASPAGDSGAAGGGDHSAKTNEEVSMTEEEAAKLREENRRLKAENQQKDLALSEAEDRKKEADRERLRAAMEGAMVPRPVQEKFLLLSESLDNGRTIELSDAEAPEGKRKVSPAGCLIEIVSAYPKPVEPGTLSLSDGEDTGSAAGRINYSAI